MLVSAEKASFPQTAPENSLARRPWLIALLLSAAFFIVMAPSLNWLPYAGGMENFNVATAQETLRDGHWLIPTLEGHLRIEKPPFTHWITSLGLMSSSDMRWGGRWPSLVLGSLTVGLFFVLGHLLADVRTGLIAAAVGATNLLFLKFARQASYDTDLTFWVVLTNVCIAWMLFARGGVVAGCAAGVALGMANMTKGPVAVLQTVVPVMVWGMMLCRKEKNPHPGPLLIEPEPQSRRPEPQSRRPEYMEAGQNRSLTRPIVAGVICLLLIALPWPIYIMFRMSGSMLNWYHQVTLWEEAKENKPGWWTYFVITPLLTPWFFWFVLGIVEIVKKPFRQSPKLWLALAWTVVPVAVMIWFPARRDRYLLPMVGPAAVVAAIGVIRCVPKWNTGNAGQRVLVSIHYATLFALAVLLPLAGAFAHLLPVQHSWKMLNNAGQPWYPANLGITLAVVGIAMFISALSAYRRSWNGFITGTVVLAMFANLTLVWGYKDAEAGMGDAPQWAEKIRAEYPGAVVINALPAERKLLPEVFLIYLDADVLNWWPNKPMPQAPGPMVLLYPHPANNITTDTPPAGFTPLGAMHVDKTVYQMYVNQPTTAP